MAAGSDRLAYTGENIRRDMRQVYLQESERLHGHLRARRRHEKLLASPRRRGACSRCRSIPTTAPSAAGARRTPTRSRPAPTAPDKRAWYEAEQRLRNQPERTYDVRMGFSLADLRRRVPGSGIDQAAKPSIVLALLGDTTTGDASSVVKTYEPAAGSGGSQPTRLTLAPL